MEQHARSALPLTPCVVFPFHVLLEKEGDGGMAGHRLGRRTGGRELLEEKHVSPTWWLSNLTLPTSCPRVDGAALRDLRALF